MSQIKLLHSGGNGVIIAAPDSNPASDRTLKLPSNADGTILTTTSPKAGNIIQVVSTTKTDTASASVSRTSDWVGHGLSVSITPSSSSNKILIFGQVTVGSDINDGISLSIFKAGSEIAGATGDAASSRQRQTAGAEMDYNFAVTTIPFHYLDTAGGTSSITYQPALNISNSGSYTIYLNRTSNDTDNASYIRTISVITAMEIAA
jgi:hypothetical protein